MYTQKKSCFFCFYILLLLLLLLFLTEPQLFKINSCKYIGLTSLSSVMVEDQIKKNQIRSDERKHNISIHSHSNFSVHAICL